MLHNKLEHVYDALKCFLGRTIIFLHPKRQLLPLHINGEFHSPKPGYYSI